MEPSKFLEGQINIKMNMERMFEKIVKLDIILQIFQHFYHEIRDKLIFHFIVLLMVPVIE